MRGHGNEGAEDGTFAVFPMDLGPDFERERHGMLGAACVLPANTPRTAHVVCIFSVCRCGEG